MSALLRALMGQQVGGGDKPNLAIDADFVTPFDHLAGRKGTTMVGKTLMHANKKYHVVCDVDFTITDAKAKIDLMMLGGYGPWHNAAAFGKFYDIDKIGTFTKKIDYTGQYYSTVPDKWCRIDCGGMKGSVRLYNIVITEV